MKSDTLHVRSASAWTPTRALPLKTSRRFENPRRRDYLLQGYLAHEKQPPPRTVEKDYASGPMVGGGLFIMSEVPLHDLSGDMLLRSAHSIDPEDLHEVRIPIPKVLDCCQT